MRHVSRTGTLVLGLVAALGLAACGSNNLATPPPVTGAPASESPARASASVPGGDDPTPVGGQVEAPAFRITARNIAFDPSAVTVPANVALTLQFDNQDSQIPHDVQISDGSGNVIVKTEVISGPAQVQFAVPALAPGAYPFACIVHPNMTGTITAE